MSGVDLAQWLTAQLDADTARATAAADGDSGEWFMGDKWNVYRAEDETPGEDVEANALVVYGNVKDQSEHIAEHDPARVLRDVEMKRKLVKLHSRATLRAGGGAQYFDTTTVCRSCEPNYQFPELSWPCTTLRLLALPYADREGYQEAWRP